MSQLVRNVYVPQPLDRDDEATWGWWGPSHGRTDPPADVAALIHNPAVWDVVPGAEVQVAGEPGGQGPAAGTEGDAETPPGDPAAGSWPLPAPDDPLDALAALPDDRDLLLRFADTYGLDVNRRLGAENMRAVLANQLGGVS